MIGSTAPGWPVDTRTSKTFKNGKNHRGLPAEHRGVRQPGNKVTEGTALYRLPTYKFLRAGRFTNALLAMLVMELLLKFLRMKTN